eukprot:superscaffoldBa00000072_g1120
MKLLSNFNERLLMTDDSTSTISTVSVSKQDVSDPTKAPKVNSHLYVKSRQPQLESGSDYLSAIFSDPQLPRLYKFESEDSGVELPSGANSPSTPTGSEQSFVVHSRESSCDSCNLNSDPATLPDELSTHGQSPEIKPAEDLVDNSLSTAVDTQDNVLMPLNEFSFSAESIELHIGENLDKDQCGASGINPEGDEERSEQLEENSAVTERICSENTRPRIQSSTEAYDDMTGNDFEPEPLRRSATTDSLEEYMDECCRLSELFHPDKNNTGVDPPESSSTSQDPCWSCLQFACLGKQVQQSSNPLGSGLGYLEHICQLIEKIGQLQETNLRLQRQICSLQKDGRMTKTKEMSFLDWSSETELKVECRGVPDSEEKWTKEGWKRYYLEAIKQTFGYGARLSFALLPVRSPPSAVTFLFFYQLCEKVINNILHKPMAQDFFQQHCSCGAASLAFQDAQKRHSRSEFLSPSGTLSDLSTIPEVTRHPLLSTRRDMSSEALTAVPLWRRGLNRRSYTEGEVHFLGDSTEGLSIPQRRLSESYTWGRVKELVRKTKLRNHSRLGLSSTSLKMSCPQLYRPDLGPVEPAGRNRNSMIALGQQSKLDFPWLQ